MVSRDERIAEAKKHQGLMKGVFSHETEGSAKAARIYEDGEGRELPLGEPRFESTKVAVERTGAERAIVAAKGAAAVVSPASYRHPGSGYANGAGNVEAMLCVASNLYEVEGLLADRYYSLNREDARGELYSDRAAFIPDAVFTENGSVARRSVIVCAPPDRKRALANHRSAAECDGDLAHRVETVMRIAADNQVDTLVVPAFGCGVQGNDPEQVARLFKAWLDAHPGMLEAVVFAVPQAQSYDTFKKVLAPEEEKPAPAPVPKAEEEDEDEGEEDWRQYLTEC